MGRYWRRSLSAAALLLGLALTVSLAAAGVLKWARLGFLQGAPGRQPAVAALAAHPTDPDVLYAGTWLTTPGAALVYRSEDGGQNWRAAADGLPTDLPATSGVVDLLIDPANPRTLYLALHRRGVWRSDDGGQSWHNIGEGVVAEDEDVVALALSGGDLYVLSAEGLNVLSGDGRWKAMNRGLPTRNVVYNDFAFDPTDEGTLYMVTSPDGLYRTTNGGRNWRAANNDLPGTTGNIKGITIDEAGRIFLTIRGVGLVRSDDAGRTWTPSGEGITYTNTLVGTVSAPVFDPADADVAYVHNSDGIFRSVDGGATWQPFNDGLSVTAVVMDISFAPARPHVALAGTAASGAWAASEHDPDPPDPPDPTPRLLFMPMIRR